MNSGWNLKSHIWADEVKLPGFEKLLESWSKVHKKFCELLAPEHSWEYQYTERPHVGFLSNAAILIDGLALEEWSTEKTFNNKRSHGRNDLWLHLSPPSSGEDYHIEVKHNRLDLQSNIEDIDYQITEAMNHACKDAERLCPKEGRLAAISFFTLRFEDKDTDHVEKSTQELMSHICEKVVIRNDIHAVGAIWMGMEDFQLSRIQRDKRAKGWKNHEVGLILLARRVK